VSNLLTAAGANLDAPSTAPGANRTNGETYRSSGIVIVIVIEYKNVQFEKDKFAYVYLPRVIDGNEYKAVESLYQSDGSYILKERHGIRLVFQQRGEIENSVLFHHPHWHHCRIKSAPKLVNQWVGKRRADTMQLQIVLRRGNVEVQIASDVGTLTYGWALTVEQPSRRTSRYFFVEFL
jgi:hypothetical protein